MAENANAAPAKRRRVMPPLKQETTKTAPTPYHVEPIIAFYIFAAAHIVAALYAPIQDCDEVYNYWEPTHYLNHGYGFQTWEYSPEYAIRSWLYAGIHAVVILFGRLVPFVSSKTAEFYFLRIMLAVVCAMCETRLFSVTQRLFARTPVALYFMVVMVTSPGLFHASAAYLPSSFAMYTAMLGMASFMDWEGGLRTASGIMWFGIGATVGWPFAGALVAPYILEELVLASVSGEVVEIVTRFLDGTVRSFIVLALEVAIDTFFYKKIVCVPWNIVAYNVFGGSGKGPDIFGTEPWHFYIRNLLLNFNAWFFLALLALPLVFLRRTSRGLTLVAPFYLWLIVFTVQPHKEERFMYPAYPSLALNAAISLHILISYLGAIRVIPAKLRLGFLSVCFLGAIDLGLWRTVGMATAYSAPLKVYTSLKATGVAHEGDTVCLGKEWYRFPSSYLLPQGVKAKFIRSEFKGLLPGEFSEADVGFGIFPGAWLVPSGMNNENKEDPGKYTSVDHCVFLVDSRLDSTLSTRLEPDHISDTNTWEKLQCEPFLDASSSHILGRLGWIPDLPFVPAKYRRRWGEYCLLKRKMSMREQV